MEFELVYNIPVQHVSHYANESPSEQFENAYIILYNGSIEIKSWYHCFRLKFTFFKGILRVVFILRQYGVYVMCLKFRLPSEKVYIENQQSNFFLSWDRTPTFGGRVPKYFNCSRSRMKSNTFIDSIHKLIFSNLHTYNSTPSHTHTHWER